MAELKQASRRDLVQALCVLFRQWLGTLDDQTVSELLDEWKEARDKAGCPVVPYLNEPETVKGPILFSAS